MSRSRKPGQGRRWRFGDCEYLELSRTLLVNGTPVRTEGKPKDVLLQLLERPTEVVTKEELLSAVWSDTVTVEQSLITAISKLRKAFGPDRDAIIVNESGIGYRMAVPVQCSFEPQSGRLLVQLSPGDPIPMRPSWLAVRTLNADEFNPVWQARNEKTGEQRVFKFASDGVRLRALQREIAVWRLLSRGLGARASFAVRVLDWNFEQAPYFIESLYEGPNLLEWSSEPDFQNMGLNGRVQLAAQLTEAVAAAHELGIFHNDLKPSNLLIYTEQGLERASIKIADFGVASLQNLELLQAYEISDHGAFSSDSTEESSPRGSAMYRAPELYTGGLPTLLGDIYALGILLYQIVCGSFFQPPVPGWQSHIPDPLLQADIDEAARVDPKIRLTSAATLAERLRTLPERRERARKEQAEAIAAQAAHEALARIRMRRPWVALALVSLCVGLFGMFWSAHTARRQRDVERKQAEILAGVTSFLAQDLLGQSNPYLRIAGSGQLSQQTLVEAIATAAPQIDNRFAHQPEIAAPLHEAIADALKSRTRFVEADREYALAAGDYRDAEGSQSQAAIIAELKRELARLAGLGPGSIERTQADYARQAGLIKQIQHPSVDLQTWQTLVSTALIGLGPHPEQGLPILKQALGRAEAAPNPNPDLIFRLKNQLCGNYVRLGDGPNLERVANDLIEMIKREHGAGSASLFPFQMYLEEAYYLEDKYQETIAQATRNYETFQRVLGTDHQLTLSTLATRAAAEAQLGNYPAAARDDLTLYHAERNNDSPAARRLAEGSLSDAADYECHSGHFAEGLEHARTVLHDTGPGLLSQPMFYNGSLYTVADCLLAQQESGQHHDPQQIAEARDDLAKVDTKATAEFSGEDQYQGFVALGLARAALLQNDLPAARKLVAQAQPFFHRNGQGVDPYQHKLLLTAEHLLGMQ